MTSIAGKYQHYKNEDIEDYFTVVGVPYVGRKMMSMSSPLMEISVDGDYMTIKNSSLLRTVENKFKLGEEYEENMPNATVKVCWIAVQRTMRVREEGMYNLGNLHLNTIRTGFNGCDYCVHGILFSNWADSVTTLINEKQMETKSVVEDTGASCGRLYDFTEDECIVTLTHEKAKTPAKRYFRRVK